MVTWTALVAHWRGGGGRLVFGETLLPRTFIRILLIQTKSLIATTATWVLAPCLHKWNFFWEFSLNEYLFPHCWELLGVFHWQLSLSYTFVLIGVTGSALVLVVLAESALKDCHLWNQSSQHWCVSVVQYCKCWYYTQLFLMLWLQHTSVTTMSHTVVHIHVSVLAMYWTHFFLPLPVDTPISPMCLLVISCCINQQSKASPTLAMLTESSCILYQHQTIEQHNINFRMHIH